MIAIRSWLIEHWCLLMKHETHWVFGPDGISVRYCAKCDLVHEIAFDETGCAS